MSETPAPDPRALLDALDALDEAHAKATMRPWSFYENRLPEIFHSADAELVTAAVNALPALTAAARAALDALRLIDQFGCTNLTRGRCSDDPSRTRDAAYTADRWCEGCIAADAMATVTAALTGGQA